MRRLLVLAAFLLAALGAAAPAVAAESTATGTGGAASSVDALATGTALAVAARRRQRRRRGGRGRGRPRRRRAVLVRASAAAASWSSTHEGRQGHDDRQPRDRAGRHVADLVLRRTGKPLAFADARAQRAVGRRARHGPRVGAGAARLRHLVARRALQPGIARRAGRLPGRRDVRRADRRTTRRRSRDVPSTAAIYLDPDGTPRDVGSTLRNPDLAGTYEAHRASTARTRFYRGPIAQAIVDAVRPPAASTTDRHAPGGVPARRHDDRRPRATTRRSSATPTHVELPRPRRLRHGPAVQRRLDRRRGAEHPRAATDLGGRDRATGAAPATWRRPRSPTPTAAPTSATRLTSTCPLDGLLSTGLRGQAARADRADARRAGPSRRATRCPTTAAPAAGRRADRAARRETTHLTVADRQGQRRLLHVHDRADRRQRDRRARAADSCSTTS